MDRNSAIGLTLIGVLLLTYFYWFSPEPQPVQPTATTTQQPASEESAAVVSQVPTDSVLTATYGEIGSVMTGTQERVVVENEDVRVTFTNKGGKIEKLELKKYQSYAQRFIHKNTDYLTLISPENNIFKMLVNFQGKEIDFHDQVFYTLSESKQADNTILTFTANIQGGSLSHIYTIPNTGYEIGYQLETKGLDAFINQESIAYVWLNNLLPIEKNLQDTRANSTITYYTEADGFDHLSNTSSDSENFTTPIKWVTIKEKFFLSSFIAENNFASGTVSTSTVSDSDTSIVKKASIQLAIPKKSLSDGTAKFKFYVGPNDYQEIDKVAVKFAKNVYLGWPPVYWINKYVIFPVFNFLSNHITNYGLIIIILVFFIKLVLLPLSYKSYISMAKMKVLKPELDEIKERVGEDMAKVQQEQMKLYQQVGVNPLSGCIPMLKQMPILFSMFYLFPASIELRQQPLLWAEDLSTFDSLIQLPFSIPFGVGSHISIFTLLMTLTTIVYTWQNNQLSAVQGPMKAMSYIMPVIFFFFLNSFAAGLTFYYTISTLVTFGQQMVIKRFVDEDKIRAIMEENKKKIATGSGKKSKFMSRLEEAMKASEEARKKTEDNKRGKK
jgi:YidC/Oxa1 family membrane protein insertase